MAEIYDEKIGKGTDWGGDASTGGKPVSGRRVQEFVKDALEQKFGSLYYDTGNNRYLVFSDDENRDAYLDDPTGNIGLLLGTFDAPANYTAEINLESDTLMSVMSGTKGVYIRFRFDVKNKTGGSTGDSVVCTYTFNNNGNKQKVTESYKAGTTVNFCADDYLKTGTNNVTIQVTGRETLASTTVSVTVQVVELDLKVNYDVSELNSEGDTLTVSYTATGAGVKYVEWYLDGVAYGEADTLTAAAVTKNKYVDLTGKEAGLHTLQARAYVVVNGTKYYSPTEYRDVVVRGGSRTLVAVSTRLESGKLSTDGSLSVGGLTQYQEFSLQYAIYDPKNRKNTIDVSVDGETIGTMSISNGQLLTLSYTPATAGEHRLKLSCQGTDRELTLVAEKSDSAFDEAKDGLTLRLSASGRSNSEADRAVWSYGRIGTTFNGFQWTSDGWQNGYLSMRNGANIEVDLQPLAENMARKGGTIELTFATDDIEDEDAVVCDLTDAGSGRGFLLTASSAKMTASGGATVETRFKSGEEHKVAVIVHPATGSDDKQLVFIMVDGVLDRATDYVSSDSFVCSSSLRLGNADGKATLNLKSVRIYGRAISEEEELGNYAVDTGEVMTVWNRNDIYEEGTTNFDIEKIASKIPVMVFTGDMPTIEATKDKNTTIYCDIEYTNMDDPDLSFTAEHVRVRPQGTSSMGYPRKNLRIYPGNSAHWYDAQGNEVEDHLYAFKKGSQRVKCYCLKADYAESSGCHNTGMAKLMNDALYYAQIDNKYITRTKAQEAAVAANYGYDVRTAIDGFPIVCFYRLSADSELVYMGQYNFNNDKSTESVFGFKDVPGFDNGKMQCWEVQNNTDPIALFTDVSGFDEGWGDAFEARYPDGNEDTGDLKRFCVWVNSCKDDAEKFGQEMKDHLDVDKVAAYYVYLMRFGAVDQTVKNAMLTTEDGDHWYYINYDNDTVNGVRNDGRLAYGPYITRQSKDDQLDNTYAYAGHDCVLWNLLEGNAAFMARVGKVDNAMYGAGLSYKNVLKVLDEEQCDRWCERIYNTNGRYKYVTTYQAGGDNNLFMLQGSRKSHRHWWLRARFDMYDAEFVSGEYKSKVIEFKAPQANGSFEITANKALKYGWGINDDPVEKGVSLSAGEKRTFTTPRVLAIGDPVRIYSATNIRGINLKNFAPNLAQLIVGSVDSTLKSIVLNADTGTTANEALTDIQGLAMATGLEELNIRNYRNLSKVSVSGLKNLRRYLADGSGALSFEPAEGAVMDLAQLPSGLQSLRLKGVTLKTMSYNPSKDLREVVIENSTLGKNYTVLSFVKTWLSALQSYGNPKEATLRLTDVEWTGVDADWMIQLASIGELNVTGYIQLKSLTAAQFSTIVDLYGQDCFKPDSALQIDAPKGLLISGPSTVDVLKTATYRATVFPISGEGTAVEYVLVANGTEQGTSYKNVKIETVTEEGETVGRLTSDESVVADTSVTVRVRFVNDTSNKADLMVTVKALTYPTSATISGEQDVKTTGDQTYGIAYNPAAFTGGVKSVEWSLIGAAEIAEIASTTNESCVVTVKSVPDVAVAFIVRAKTSLNNGTSLTADMRVTAGTYYVVRKATNPAVMKVLFDSGLAANENFITDEEVSAVTASKLGQIFRGNTMVTSFEELENFTALTEIPDLAFYQCKNIERIKLPKGLTKVGRSAFNGCQMLKELDFPDTVTVLAEQYRNSAVCSGCSRLVRVHLPDGLTRLSGQAFKDCINLEEVDFPSKLVDFYGTDQFNNCRKLKRVELPTGLTNMPYAGFKGCSNLSEVTVPDTVSEIGDYCFASCMRLKRLRIEAESAPNTYEHVFGSVTGDNGDLTGWFTKSGGTEDDGQGNVLYVKLQGYGYNTGVYQDPLQVADKCGFVVSYDND